MINCICECVFVRSSCLSIWFFFFQAEDGIRDFHVTGVQTCALPIYTMSLAQTGSRTRIPKTPVEGRRVVDSERINTRAITAIFLVVLPVAVFQISLILFLPVAFLRAPAVTSSRLGEVVVVKAIRLLRRLAYCSVFRRHFEVWGKWRNWKVRKSD